MKTYVIDIDGTICSNTYGKYENATPFDDRISVINKLYKDGNIIKFFTSIFKICLILFFNKEKLTKGIKKNIIMDVIIMILLDKLYLIVLGMS